MAHEYEEIKKDFWDRFAQRSASKDALDMNRPARLEFETFFSFLDLPPGSKLLDFGCGTGRYAIPLAHLGYEVTGVDSSEGSLSVLRDNATGAGVNAKLHLRHDDFRKEVFADVFNGAYCINVLYQAAETREERARILANVVKAVKKRGVILAVEPNPLNPLYLPFFLFHPDVSWRIERKFLASSPANLKHRFQEVGLDEIQVRHYAMLPTRLMNTCPWVEQLNRWLCAVPGLRQFSLFTFIRGTKR